MSKSILSVNGSKAMNYLLQTIFENEYRFLPAADVFEAMRQLKLNRQPGALIVDVDFQPQQSWDFIQHIKSSKLYKIPVIVLATDNTEVVKQKSYEFELDEIFFKPFNPVDLIAAIQNLTTAPMLSNV
ncbi:MAG TPA: response regulator [Flavisolibacter sp.]|nr:response regulator [Flavisolibacter sp.]